MDIVINETGIYTQDSAANMVRFEDQEGAIKELWSAGAFPEYPPKEGTYEIPFKHLFEIVIQWQSKRIATTIWETVNEVEYNSRRNLSHWETRQVALLKKVEKEEIDRIIINPSDRDWTEDFSHENGNYQNECIECHLLFNGHKRRVICKKCSTPNWIELAKKKPPEDTKQNQAWHGAWLEGEMVGYAKCMVENVLKPLPANDEPRGEGWEESWEKVNRELSNGVNPHAYRLGWLYGKQSTSYNKALEDAEEAIKKLLARKFGLLREDQFYMLDSQDVIQELQKLKASSQDSQNNAKNT